MRKRRIGMICLATALPLVADEAYMDDRFGSCCPNSTRTAISTTHAAADDRRTQQSNKTANWLFPFEQSYGNIIPSRTDPQFLARQWHEATAPNQTRSQVAHTKSRPLSPTIRPLPYPTEHHGILQNYSASREPQQLVQQQQMSLHDEEKAKPVSTKETTEEVQKVDYASKSVGAILLESSKPMKGTSNLLQKDQDLYAIVACADVGTSETYVTIGLSEDILVKQLEISNFERYSGSMRHLHAYSSTTVNNQWKDLGIYELPNIQTITFELRQPVWARYLKLEFLDYYGNEHYCTISQISVYGSTMLQGFHEQYYTNEEANDEMIAVESITRSDDAETAKQDETVFDDDTWDTTDDTSHDDVLCNDMESLECFERLVLRSNVTEHVSSRTVRKPHTIRAITTQHHNMPRSKLADLEPPKYIPQEPVDPVLHVLLQRFPNAKCLEQLKNHPKLHSGASPGHSASHDGGLEPIFTKFSAEIKALQSDVSALSEYVRLSHTCYQSLLLESSFSQKNLQDDHAERLAALERELHHRASWFTHITTFLTTQVSDAMNSKHGKRLGSVLTSSVWNDAWFCGMVCVLLLSVFLYLGGSRYQGRITIRRRRSLLESTEVTNNEAIAEEVTALDETSKVVTPVAVVSSVSEPAVVLSDDTVSETKKRRRRKMGLKSVLR